MFAFYCFYNKLSRTLRIKTTQISFPLQTWRPDIQNQFHWDKKLRFELGWFFLGALRWESDFSLFFSASRGHWYSLVCVPFFWIQSVSSLHPLLSHQITSFLPDLLPPFVDHCGCIGSNLLILDKVLISNPWHNH